MSQQEYPIVLYDNFDGDSINNSTDSTIIEEEKFCQKLVELNINESGYLPKEEDSSPLTKTILKSVWSMTVMKQGLGCSNEKEVRNWFSKNPDMHVYFQKWNEEIANFIKSQQSKAVEELKKQSELRKGLLDKYSREVCQKDYQME